MRFLLALPSLLLAFAHTSLAAGITDGDVPDGCKSVCRPLVQLSGTCSVNGTQASSMVQQESDCICNNKSFDVKSIGSLCAICITQNNKVTPDLQSISSECGFTQTQYNQISASSIAATVTVTATRPGTNQGITVAPSPTKASGGTASSKSSKAGAAAMPTAAAMGIAGTALQAGLLMLLV